VATQTNIQCIFQLLHVPVDKNKYNEHTEVTVLYRVLQYVLILGLNLHIFIVTMRITFILTDFMRLAILFLRIRIRYCNCLFSQTEKRDFSENTAVLFNMLWLPC
jgi:hypothetical protein